MPKYPLSDGSMLDKKIIDRRIAQAKEQYSESFYNEHGYFFCERTLRSDSIPERSHIISVKECQNSGRSELAWCQWNLELLNRDSHDEIHIWSNAKREAWYHERKDGVTYEEFIDSYQD